MGNVAGIRHSRQFPPSRVAFAYGARCAQVGDKLPIAFKDLGEVGVKNKFSGFWLRKWRILDNFSRWTLTF